MAKDTNYIEQCHEPICFFQEDEEIFIEVGICKLTSHFRVLKPVFHIRSAFIMVLVICYISIVITIIIILIIIIIVVVVIVIIIVIDDDHHRRCRCCCRHRRDHRRCRVIITVVITLICCGHILFSVKEAYCIVAIYNDRYENERDLPGTILWQWRQ